MVPLCRGQISVEGILMTTENDGACGYGAEMLWWTRGKSRCAPTAAYTRMPAAQPILQAMAAHEQVINHDGLIDASASGRHGRVVLFMNTTSELSSISFLTHTQHRILTVSEAGKPYGILIGDTGHTPSA